MSNVTTSYLPFGLPLSSEEMLYVERRFREELLGSSTTYEKGIDFEVFSIGAITHIANDRPFDPGKTKRYLETLSKKISDEILERRKKTLVLDECRKLGEHMLAKGYSWDSNMEEIFESFYEILEKFKPINAIKEDDLK